MMLGGVLVLGAVAGVHVATWGAYKDSPYEGFRPASYVRSLLLATAVAVCTLAWPPTRNPSSILVVLGVVYAFERLATEWWKAIVRVDDQSRYSIPMRLGFHGRPVDNPGVRYTIGVLIVVAMISAMLLAVTIEHAVPHLPTWLVVVTVGAAGGWTTAIGGAWKDAPIEGFSFAKFLRSPAVATLWAVPLSLLTTDWVTLALAAGGMAVASIETYKTFLTGGRPPGKFATQLVRYGLGRTRRVLATVHALLWAALAGSLLAEQADPLSTVGKMHIGGLIAELPILVAAVPVLAAAGFAVLIVASTAHGTERFALHAA